MGLFTKKEQKETIPDIPPAPQFTKPNESTSIESYALPVPPQIVINSSEKKGDSGAASSPPEKFEESIVAKQYMPNPAPRLPTLPPQTQMQQRPPLPSFMQPKPQTVPEMKQVTEEPKVKPEELSFPQDQTVKKDFNETIFVRIDKFTSAKRDLDEIERDLKQIEDVLTNLNEVKIREDEEITALNKNIEEIKSKLSSMDSDIFNRI